MPKNLPPELIEDILRRLPAKSLKRLRSVTKSWCLLIDSENFIKLHLHTSLISNSNRKLILGGLGLYSIDLDSLDKAIVIKPAFYYKSVDGISNSCNGLVLVMSAPPVVWNPFTRDYKVLPDCGDDDPIPLDSYSKTAYGFGSLKVWKFGRRLLFILARTEMLEQFARAELTRHVLFRVYDISNMSDFEYVIFRV